jgi:hypothetical protein
LTLQLKPRKRLVEFFTAGASMKKITIVAGCLLIFCAGWTSGQQSVAASNGPLWKTLSLSARTSYVKGFSDGHAVGMGYGMRDLFNVIREVMPEFPRTPKERREVIEKADQINQKSAAENSRFTVSQIEATVSTFYDDDRNVAVCWGDATWLSTLSLEGNHLTEQALDAARNKGAKSGCK